MGAQILPLPRRAGPKCPRNRFGMGFAVRGFHADTRRRTTRAVSPIRGEDRQVHAHASPNYHSACRGRSRAEFISRLGVALDEADEAERWLEVLKDSGLASGAEVEWLSGESGELRAILFASVTTARLNRRADLNEDY